MTESEIRVFEAAFVAEWAAQRRFKQRHGGDPGDIDGFACAEVADVCVEAFRDALTCDSAEYLLGYGKIEVTK